MAIHLWCFVLFKTNSANIVANIFHTWYGLIVIKRSAKILLFYETSFIITSATDIL